ncbi:hypothetical protein V6N12_006281 [Hibiscus sabdariffa]|uniref:Uncharacterized protein n=1 Tax=Hibiscus sabdariffa TaxID=183260 RepID=A0ABR2EYC1_9ROSI
MENKRFIGHAIVLPYPSQGHINPLLQFAKRLASKGITATLLTTRYTVGSICAPRIGVEAISDGFDQGGYSQAGDVEFYLESFREQGSRTLSQLIDKFKCTGTPVTCVVFFSRIHHGRLTLPLTLETTPLMLPRLPLLNFRDLSTFLRFPDSYPAYLAMKLSQFSNLNHADWIFDNTFEDLEGKEAKGMSEL